MQSPSRKKHSSPTQMQQDSGLDPHLYPNGLGGVFIPPPTSLWGDADPRILARSRQTRQSVLLTTRADLTERTGPLPSPADTPADTQARAASHGSRRHTHGPDPSATTAALRQPQPQPASFASSALPSSTPSLSLSSRSPLWPAPNAQGTASASSAPSETLLYSDGPLHGPDAVASPDPLDDSHAHSPGVWGCLKAFDPRNVAAAVLPHPSVLPPAVASFLGLPQTKETGRTIFFPAAQAPAIARTLVDSSMPAHTGSRSARRKASRIRVPRLASRWRGAARSYPAASATVEMQTLASPADDEKPAGILDGHSIQLVDEIETGGRGGDDDDQASGTSEQTSRSSGDGPRQAVSVTASNAADSVHSAHVNGLAARFGWSWFRRANNRTPHSPLTPQKSTLGQTTSLLDADAPVAEIYPPYATKDYPPNMVKNQKYHPATFLFVVLYEQFKFFFNLYFLGVAITQFFPILQIGFLFTYLAPLAFVLSVTIGKEAYDDFKRYVRDKEANSQLYERLTPNGPVKIPSSDIRVGDMIIINTDQRIPADMVMLRTSEKGGASFIRTDQLDGETDWKLRQAVPSCQGLPSDQDLILSVGKIQASKPSKEIYNFVGTCTLYKGKNEQNVEPLSLENTVWANTVLASGRIIGLVVFTGCETRSVMNASIPATKVGLLDQKLNHYSKILFALTISLSLILVLLKGVDGIWYIYLFRFILLFSSIIPISLRVNLDMGKTVYSAMIMRDDKIKDTIVRTSTIPEELGQITYLLSDKTGTLTKNEMIFKKLHIGEVLYTVGSLDELMDDVKDSFKTRRLSTNSEPSRDNVVSKAVSAIYSLALCHSVTPVHEGEENSDDATIDIINPVERGNISYHACSPDEIALVKFSEMVGLALEYRTRTAIYIRTPANRLEGFDILNVFPFTSETKRMGIILREHSSQRIIFYMKGADTVMANIVQESDWLTEECGNMARSGLRTLVFGRKFLTEEQYSRFSQRYATANASLENRAGNIRAVIDSLENDLELICLTGVEDQLQDCVKESLEMMRNAGIKIWMLTGDKVETATCIAISSKLVSRNQSIFTLLANDESDAKDKLMQFSRKTGTCLVIDGKSLTICLDRFPTLFAQVACKAPSVVCCRCSPTQKADIVRLLKNFTKKKTCAIGDGGNDVSMIQAADIGLGIVGKEGKQASLAADFSLMQFSHIRRLLHKRSARLAQFVIHRGLIISMIQAVFSALYFYAPVAIYNGWLLVGYATVYTMAPVFSLVLDEDVEVETVFLYPELYRELQKGRALSDKTFFIWVFKSIYQGGIIMILTIMLFESSFIYIVSITFTVLVFTELLNVALEINTWHRLMVYAEVASVVVYIISMVVLQEYFGFLLDARFISSWTFIWKICVITLTSCLPIYIAKYAIKRYNPPAYLKLR